MRRFRRDAGQAMVETVLVLLVFLTTLIAAIDFSQVLFTHQMMVERVRMGLRYGMVKPWDGGDGVANMILYAQPSAKANNAATFLGLTRDNVLVTQTPGTEENPNDLRLKVSIVNYRFRLYTPFLARQFINNYAVVETAPILYRN